MSLVLYQFAWALAPCAAIGTYSFAFRENLPAPEIVRLEKTFRSVSQGSCHSSIAWYSPASHRSRVKVETVFARFFEGDKHVSDYYAQAKKLAVCFSYCHSGHKRLLLPLHALWAPLLPLLAMLP